MAKTTKFYSSRLNLNVSEGNGFSAKDWNSFAEVIGEPAVPDHLRLHNPSWSLTLMRDVARARWKERGRDGSPGIPGEIGEPPVLIGTEMDIDPLPIVPPSVAKLQKEAIILNEGRKRKAVDYRQRLIIDDEDEMDLDGEDERGRSKHRRGSRPLEGGQVLPPSVASPEMPKAPYSGKRRGRPPKNRNSETHSEPMILGEDSSLRPQSPIPVMGPERYQRQEPVTASIKPGEKDWSKLSVQAKSKEIPRNPMRVETETAVRRNFSFNVLQTEEQKRHYADARDAIKELKRRTGSNQPPKLPETVPAIPSTLSDHVAFEPNGLTLQKNLPKLPPVTHSMPEITDPSFQLLSEASARPSSPPSSQNEDSDYQGQVVSQEDIDPPWSLSALPQLPLQIRSTIPRTPELFSRMLHISPLLGGEVRRTFVRCGRKDSSPLNVTGYLALQPKYHHLIPSKAGENGSILQIQTDELDDIVAGQAHSDFPVFVWRNQNEWEYCGQYEAEEKIILTRYDRFKHLRRAKKWVNEAANAIFKSNNNKRLGKRHNAEWAKSFLMENHEWTLEQWNSVTVEKLEEQINLGNLPVGWVHLKCVGYNLELYRALVQIKVDSI